MEGLGEAAEVLSRRLFELLENLARGSENSIFVCQRETDLAWNQQHAREMEI